MAALTDNPFAVLSAVAAPAILTNACSVLALGTANRIARAVDRTRAVMALQADHAADRLRYETYAQQLKHLHRRGNMLLKALRFFYAALAMFATTALTAIVGSIFVAFDWAPEFHFAALFGFGVGLMAVGCIVTGCSLMVRETRLAMRGLSEEYDFFQRITAPENP